MTNTTTIRILTDYQLRELQYLILTGALIAKIGICIEDGSLIINYRGGYNSYDGIEQTRIIPIKPIHANKKNNKE